MRVLLSFMSLSLLALPVWPASPSAGVLSPDTPSILFRGGPYLASNPTGIVGLDVCGPEGQLITTCDEFALTVDLPEDYFAEHPRTLAIMQVGWFNPLSDMAIGVYSPDGTPLQLVDSGGNPELLSFPLTAGVSEYRLRVVPFTGHGDSILGEIRLFEPEAAPLLSGPVPSFVNYAAPQGVAESAGEPTLDVSLATDAIFYIAGLETLKVEFDDAVSPAEATWSDVSFLSTSIETLDPILVADREKGRIFVSQLAGATSLMAFSDDDGATWLPSQGAGQPHGVDHQSLASGPYPKGLELLSLNPSFGNAVYYCSQELYVALCARSDDGGLTFKPSVAISTSAECSSLHGHVKVGPDGVVYVPINNCKGRQAVVSSEDAGITWEVRHIPLSTAAVGTDPSLGLATDGSVYFGYQSTDGQARVAVSRDHGLTWGHDTDVGAALGLEHIMFPAVVAGDPDRAAFAFLGTSEEGYPGSTDFAGEWFLFVATTYDGGQHWNTVQATPTPVQRAGGICSMGLACGNNRNLLDFMDMIVDGQGRIVISFADGCVGACELEGPNSFSKKGNIARQLDGPRLFAAFDPAPGAPEKAKLGPVLFSPEGVTLAWSAPASSGSVISSYSLYRGEQASDLQLLASVPPGLSYQDTQGQAQHFYAIAAANDEGLGPRSDVKQPAAASAETLACAQNSGLIDFALAYGACTANRPPLAKLQARQELDASGAMDLHLDGSGSQDPDGHALVNFAFEFGDASPAVNQSNSTIQHRYVKPGYYRASLVVTDEKGARSPAQEYTFEVREPVSSRSTNAGNRGGALSWMMLLGVFGAVLTRRRRLG